MRILKVRTDTYVNLDNIVSIKIDKNMHAGNSVYFRYIGETNTFGYGLSDEEVIELEKKINRLSRLSLNELLGVVTIDGKMSDPYEEGGL